MKVMLPKVSSMAGVRNLVGGGLLRSVGGWAEPKEFGILSVKAGC